MGPLSIDHTEALLSNQGTMSMEQNGNGDNRIQIGHAGHGNSFKIEQQVGAGPIGRYTELKCDDTKPVHRFEPGELERKGRKSWATLAVAGVVGVLSIISNFLQLSQYLGFSSLWIFAIVVPVSLFLFSLGLDDFHLYGSRPRKHPSTILPDGRVIQKTEDGGYVVYWIDAACIYPKCAGRIIPAQGPPKCREVFPIVGICTHGGKIHSYAIDYNFVATPKEFDWSPPPPPDRR